MRHVIIRSIKGILNYTSHRAAFTLLHLGSRERRSRDRSRPRLDPGASLFSFFLFFFPPNRARPGNHETHSSVATMRGILGRFDASVARFR